ncbi:MAG: T9SS type A sorting domain-containing protein [Bacteroidota bacterium]
MQYLFSFIFILLLQANVTAQTTFALRLENPIVNGNIFTVDVAMAGSQAFNLGSSNLQFLFDERAIDNPSLVSHRLTESFGPFTVYNTPTVTEPIPGKASLNIVLIATNVGDQINDRAQGFTTIATIAFDIIDDTRTVDLMWSYTGTTTETVVFAHDDLSQLFANSPADLEGLSNQALPVNWSTFSVTRRADNNRYVDIFWSTDYEQNNDFFTVERSENGSDWYGLARVTANNQLNGSDYYYRDTDTPSAAERLYYRIKQTDFDGSFTYSELRSISWQVNGPDLQVYPSLFSDGINVVNPVSTDDQGSDMTFYLYNNQGVLQLKGSLIAGENTIDQLGGYPVGTYILQLVGPKTKQVYKLLKTKK